MKGISGCHLCILIHQWAVQGRLTDYVHDMWPRGYDRDRYDYITEFIQGLAYNQLIITHGSDLGNPSTHVIHEKFLLYISYLCLTDNIRPLPHCFLGDSYFCLHSTSLLIKCPRETRKYIYMLNTVHHMWQVSDYLVIHETINEVVETINEVVRLNSHHFVNGETNMPH